MAIDPFTGKGGGAADDPWRELEALSRRAREDARKLGEAGRRMGETAAGAERSRKTFERSMRSLESESARRPPTRPAPGTGAAVGVGISTDPAFSRGIGSGFVAGPAGSGGGARRVDPGTASATRAQGLLRAETDGVKKLDKAQRDLAKTEERLRGLRLSRETATGGSRAEIDREIAAAEQTRLKQQERITDRRGAVEAARARLAVEQQIQGTLTAQEATIQRILAAESAVARSAQTRMLGQMQSPAGSNIVPAGGLPRANFIPIAAAAYGGAGGGFIGRPPALPPGYSPRALPPGPRPPLGLPSGQPAGFLPRGPDYWSSQSIFGAPQSRSFIGQRSGPSSLLGEAGMKWEDMRKGSRGAGVFNNELGITEQRLREVGNRMRQHGALTTEFISATQRGAVSIRELGYQLGAVTGKFGGWLAAGSLIYGGIGVARNIGEGAIQSQSGVQQLRRVVPDVDEDQASRRFRDLASTYQVSIEDVSGAAFEMGKAFDDQRDSLIATEAVLGAVRVGELDVATAGQQLTSIVHGFNLEAQDMITLFDQINAAQNQFGVPIGSTVSGIARAAGLMREAGGDPSNTLALIGTAARVTGQSGNVAGTALSRSPNFLRQNAGELREFGIDPDAPYTELIEQAFDAVRGQGGKRTQEVAAAIFGNRYGARIGTPLLANEDLYRDFQERTSPLASEGSAMEELQSVLGEIREEVQLTGVEFERMGSVMMDIGLFDFLAGGLKLFNDILGAANSLLEVFASLPDPLRQSVVYLGQMAGAVALMRRFNIGPSIAAGADGQPTGFRAAAAAFTTRESQEAFLHREGLVQSLDPLAEEQRRSVNRAYTSGIRAQTVSSEIRNLEGQTGLRASAFDEAGGRRYVPIVESMDEELVHSAERINTLEGEYASLKQQELRSMAESEEIRRLQIQKQGQLNVLDRQKGRISDTQIVALRDQFGEQPTTLDTDMNALAAVDDDIRQQLQEAEAVAQRTLDDAAPAPDTRTFRQRVTGARVAIARNLAATSFFGRTIGEANADTISASERARQSIRRGTIAVGRGVRATGQRLAPVIRGFGQGLRAFGMGIYQLINPMTTVIAAAGIIMAGISQMNQRRSEFEQAIAGIDNIANEQDFNRVGQQLQESASADYSILDAAFGNASQQAQIAGSRRVALYGARAEQVSAFFRGQDQVLMTAEEAAQQAERDVEMLQEQLEGGMWSTLAGGIRGAAGASLPGPLSTLGPALGIPADALADLVDDRLTPEEIEKEISERTEDYQQSRLQRRDFMSAIDNLRELEEDAVGTVRSRAERADEIVEQIRSSELDQELKRQLVTRTRIEHVAGAGTDPRLDLLQELDLETLSGELSSFADAVATGLAGFDTQRQLFAHAASLFHRTIRSNDPGDIALAHEALTSMVDPVREAAQVELDRALILADSQRERSAAYQEYFDAISGDAQVNDVVSRVRQDARALEQAQRERASLQRDSWNPGEVLQGGLSLFENLSGIALPDVSGRSQPFDREAMRKNRNRRKQLARRIEGLREMIPLIQEELEAAEEEMREERFEELLGERQARASLRRSRLPAGIPRLRQSLADTRRDIEASLRFHGEMTNDIAGMLEEEQSIIAEIIQSQLRVQQIRHETAGVRFTNDENPVPGLQHQLSGLQETLGFQRAHPRVFDEESVASTILEIRETEAQIDQALEERAEQAREDAEQINDLREDIRVARLQNQGRELAAIGTQMRAARGDFRRAREIEDPQQRKETRMETRASLIDLRGQRRDELLQTEIEDVEFSADIGEMTLQQQISAYEKLLKTMQLTRDQRRDLRRRIHQLKEEAENETGGFDLRVGDIQLPTVYEIRRAMEGGVNRNTQVNAQQTNNYYVSGSNAQEIVDRINNNHEDASRRNRSLMRSTGVI